MKKIVLVLLFIINSFAINFVIGTPNIKQDTNMIVKMAIMKGYKRQVWDFLTRIQDQDVDINVKNMQINIYTSNKPKIKYLLKQDKKAVDEFDAFIKKLDSDVSDTSTEDIQLNSVSLSDSSLGSLNFKKGDLKALREDVVKGNNIDSNFKTILNKLKQNYKCEDGVCMPFYLPINPKIVQVQINGKIYRKKLLTDYKMLKPDLFFFEYFSPQKRGRRYFLNINIYVVTIDSDGEANFESEPIKDFNWRRNYRFIAAQSGAAIREIITKKAEVDIR